MQVKMGISTLKAILEYLCAPVGLLDNAGKYIKTILEHLCVPNIDQAILEQCGKTSLRPRKGGSWVVCRGGRNGSSKLTSLEDSLQSGRLCRNA